MSCKEMRRSLVLTALGVVLAVSAFGCSATLPSTQSPGSDYQAVESTVSPSVPATLPSLPVASSVGQFKAVFIDVGQGDSTLLILPDGQTVLIDAGTQGATGAVLDTLRNAGVRRIDHLVATHPHEDHIGGLDDVLRTFDVGAVYMPRVSNTTAAFESLLRAVSDEGLKVRTAEAGVQIAGGEGFSVGFVAPMDTSYEDINDYSAAVKIVHGRTSMLVSGDLTEESESGLGAEVGVDLLRVGHHGAKDSSSERFLSLVKPKVAIISVGADNRYGHPAGEALARLAAFGTDVYRTDQGGTITAVSDGLTLTLDREPLGK